MSYRVCGFRRRACRTPLRTPLWVPRSNRMAWRTRRKLKPERGARGRLSHTGSIDIKRHHRWGTLRILPLLRSSCMKMTPYNTIRSNSSKRRFIRTPSWTLTNTLLVSVTKIRWYIHLKGTSTLLRHTTILSSSITTLYTLND